MTVKIMIEGDGLNYSGDTNVVKAAQIIAFVSTEVGQTTVMHQGGAPVATAPMLGSQFGGGQSSPRQALKDANAVTNPQKIAALGNFISKKNETGVFSVKELQEAFRRAGESLPGNFSRDIKGAVSIGLITQAENPNEYFVTEFGTEEIETKFANTPTAVTGGSTKTRGSSKNRPTRTALTNPLIDALPLQPDVDNMPGFWSPKLKDNKSLQIVWLLEFAKNNNILELATSDIEAMAKRLGGNIPVNGIGSKSLGLMKKQFITKNSNGTYRIIRGGSDFLKELMLAA